MGSLGSTTVEDDDTTGTIILLQQWKYDVSVFGCPLDVSSSFSRYVALVAYIFYQEAGGFTASFSQRFGVFDLVKTSF